MHPATGSQTRFTLPPLAEDGQSRPLAYARILWRRRRLIALQAVGVAILASVTVLLLPSWYRARTVVLPPQTDEGPSLSSMLAGVRLPGVQLPGATSQIELYVAVLRSRWVGEKVVRRFELQRRYHAKSMDDAVAALAKHTRIATSDEGTIVVAVEDRDRQRSADMTNAYVEYLDLFNRENRTTRGKAARVFIERRLGETSEELRAAEDELTAYQRLHRGVALTADAAGNAQAGASMTAQRMSLAVRLDALRASLAPGSPEITQAQTELTALDRQLGQLPTVGVELARLFRRVKTDEQLYALLTAQYEEARVMEARDTPTVDVLDRATPPARRARPQRRSAVLTATGLAVAWSVLLAFALEAASRFRRAP